MHTNWLWFSSRHHRLGVLFILVVPASPPKPLYDYYHWKRAWSTPGAKSSTFNFKEECYPEEHFCKKSSTTLTSLLYCLSATTLNDTIRFVYQMAFVSVAVLQRSSSFNEFLWAGSCCYSFVDYNLNMLSSGAEIA